MRLGSLFGWGLVIYAIAYLEWSAFVVYGLAGTTTPRICQFATLVTLALIAGRSLKYRTWKDILPYSLGWVAVIAALDALFAAPFDGLSFYLNGSLWFGYSIVAFVPLFAPFTQQSDASRASWLS